MRYCPICDASSDQSEFIGELCISCFRKRELPNLPGRLEIERCKRCGRVKAPSGWTRGSRSSLDAIAARGLKAKGYRVSLDWIDYDAGKASAAFETEEEGEKVSIERGVEISIRSEICEVCSRRAAGYYEAIVQLRGRHEKVERFAGVLTGYLEKRNAFVSKLEEHGYGLDMYTSDKRITQGFLDGRGIKAKRSFRLYGVKNGKNLYRHIYSVEL